MHQNSFFFLPSYNTTSSNSEGLAFWVLIFTLLGIVTLGYTSIDLDHAFLISSNSRALYVDEGFYSDAAQNYAKFGEWKFIYDFPHWAGAPLLAFIQCLVFPAFGASLETARMISVLTSFFSALVFYALLRMSMRPFSSVLLTISGVLTFNFVAFSRTAFVDPISVLLSLLALLSFARIRIKELAIPISVAFAFLAFFSKLYYLFTIAAIITLWAFELVLIPMYTRRKIYKKQLALLAACIAVSAAFYALFLYFFNEPLTEYLEINAHSLPYLDIEYIWGKVLNSFHQIPYDTKTRVFLVAILLAGIAGLTLSLFPGQRAALRSRLTRLSRAEVAVLLWLLVGLLGVGVGQTIKPHYHFFTILPFAFAAAISIKLVLPSRISGVAICLVAALHLFHQWPYYNYWTHRPQRMALYNASRDVIRLINRQNKGSTMIPVIGEYASQLGLFSERVFSLDAKWHPAYDLCERLAYWRPLYHINVAYNSRSKEELAWINECDITEKTQELARYDIIRGDQLVLSRIDYVK